MKQAFQNPLSLSLFVLSALLIMSAIVLQWKISDSQHQNAIAINKHQAQLVQHENNNVYYRPEATADWLASLQHPEGYFVASHERLPDPSQLNVNTLETTGFAIATLDRLGKLETVNRAAVIDYLFGLYQPVTDKTGNKQASFSAMVGSAQSINATRHALLILKSLHGLGDPRLNLSAVKTFILGQQGADGGFAETVPGSSRPRTSLTTTADAAIVLNIIYSHQNLRIDPSLMVSIQKFVKNTLDSETGGYTDIADVTAMDSFDTYHAFNILWRIAGGTEKARGQFVKGSMNQNEIYFYLVDKYYLSSQAAFSRTHGAAMKPSLTATRNSIQIMIGLGLENQYNAEQIGRYAAGQQAPSGQFGDDIASTSAAIDLLQRLGVATQPRQAPQQFAVRSESLSHLYTLVLFLLSMAALISGFILNKKTLSEMNKNLLKEANTDGLTGIYNRKYFEHKGHELINSCGNIHQKLSLISVSVDELHIINDARGHLAGDIILNKLVELISPAIDKNYVFARWGGGVFMILAPGVDHANAENLCRDIGASIDNHRFGFKRKLSCSFAVTEFKDGDDIEKLTYRVDKILSQLKVNKMRSREIGVHTKTAVAQSA